jgi:hypothetical protein
VRQKTHSKITAESFLVESVDASEEVKELEEQTFFTQTGILFEVVLNGLPQCLWFCGFKHQPGQEFVEANLITFHHIKTAMH